MLGKNKGDEIKMGWQFTVEIEIYHKNIRLILSVATL